MCQIRPCAAPCLKDHEADKPVFCRCGECERSIRLRVQNYLWCSAVCVVNPVIRWPGFGQNRSRPFAALILARH